jgi:hypothetical protein
MFLLPLVVLGLAACSEKDRLMGKAWTCLPTEEMRLSIKFLNDNKLEGQLALADPESEKLRDPGRAPMSIKMKLGGQWVQPEEGRMDFAFRSAEVTEAKRGDQPLSDSDVFFYKEMFETSPKTSTKIVELSGNKFTYQELSSDKTVTCTR